MKMRRGKQSGFSLIETLITIILVGILSAACATMLIFAYSMFEKVRGNGTASIEYKTFRFTTEKIFRNMTQGGPLVYDIINNDICSRENRPPITDKEKEECIKMDVEYFPLPYNGKVYARKYYQDLTVSATTRYRVSGGIVDDGIWEGHVGRSVSLYSCNQNEKIDENYKRFLFTMETSPETGKKMVVLYSWDIVKDVNGKFLKIDSEALQNSTYPLTEAKREVLLHDVYDFQVTNRLSNLYPNRIDIEKFKDISSVRIFVKLGEDADTQYSNDFIFANKSIYGDVDSFFPKINAANVGG